MNLKSSSSSSVVFLIIRGRQNSFLLISSAFPVHYVLHLHPHSFHISISRVFASGFHDIM